MTTIDGAAATPTKLEVELPTADGAVDQDREWCLVQVDGKSRRIRFHDYGEIYSIPGLYEHIFYELLECCSPSVVTSLLSEALASEGDDASDLTVLDLGAGNGMVGELLAEMGADSIVGVDVIEEAAAAAERDRPDVYEDYLVRDFTKLSGPERRSLRSRGFNCLTTVAALGFGDIPPLAFAEAYNAVATDGWVALNIKDDFLNDRDSTGFARLLGRVLDDGILDERARRVYCHRLSMRGEPLDYVAIVGRKRADIPAELVELG